MALSASTYQMIDDNPDNLYAVLTGHLDAGVAWAAIRLQSAVAHYTSAEALRMAMTEVANELTQLSSDIHEVQGYHDSGRRVSEN